MITTKDIQDLRARTGAGIVDCKNALNEANGDIEKAIEILREKGKAAASRKAGRIAAEGLVDAYIHFGGKIGVLVEVNCETDFVARSDEFKELVHNIAIHIAAANPLYLTPEDVPTEALEKEKEILRVQALNEGKPANVVDKMVEGRVKKFYQEVCLLEQNFVKDPSKTIKDLVAEATGKIGEKISIRRFVRMEVGEGLEKRSDNLAEEVAKQIENMKNK
ncbi:MAG TPA: translation elongation factor Ts [Clostridia bacterium]|jgi:elongation factor Ts